MGEELLCRMSQLNAPDNNGTSDEPWEKKMNPMNRTESLTKRGLFTRKLVTVSEAQDHK